MLDRYTLKQTAKDNLRGVYGMAILVTFIFYILGGIGGSGTGGSISFVNQMNQDTWELVLRLLPILFIVGIAGIALSLLVSNVISVGYKYYFLKNARHETADVADLFGAFREGRYWNTVLAMFLYGLIVGLLTLCFIIPGIIFSYKYRFLPYILMDNPGITAGDALAASSRLSDGRKWEMFVLDLSFLGWILLTFLTCGIGMLFLQPYIEATWAELYRSLAHN